MFKMQLRKAQFAAMLVLSALLLLVTVAYADLPSHPAIETSHSNKTCHHDDKFECLPHSTLCNDQNKYLCPGASTKWNYWRQIGAQKKLGYCYRIPDGYNPGCGERPHLVCAESGIYEEYVGLFQCDKYKCSEVIVYDGPNGPCDPDAPN